MTIRDEAFSGIPLSCYVVDAHTHIGPYYNMGWYQTPSQTSMDAVIAMMGRLGIDCIVTAPHILVSGDMTAANIEAAEAIAAYSGKVYGYITICPSAGLDTVRDELNGYRNHPGFLGLKFLGGYHGSYMQPEYLYAADFANEMSCPLLVHTWSNTPPLAEIAKISEERPNLSMICAHQGGGEDRLTRELTSIMKDVPNIFMEICGSLVNEMPFAEMAGLAGEDRIIYGSDMINLDPRYDFGRVVLSELSDDIKRKILSENYLRLLSGSSMGKINISM